LLIILFNLGIVLWINKYNQIFVQQFIEPEAKSSSELEIFASNYEITARELDVIKLICKGKTNKEIADQLFISISTVKDHNYKIYQKLNIKNRTQLMKLYFEFQDNLQ
jgi:DNA-binding NarL/FixJ family response regulator